VHLSVYTHADLERLGTEYPLLALRQYLERSMNPPIDVPRLKTAAAIVMEHVKNVAGEFRSGWPAQRERYTAEMTARLDAVTANPDRGVDLTDQGSPTALGPLPTTVMNRTVGTVGTVGHLSAELGE
jgi:hypothetical protein